MDNSSLFQEDVIVMSKSVVFNLKVADMEGAANSINNTSIDDKLNRPMIDTTYSVRKKRNTVTSPMVPIKKNEKDSYYEQT
jgi:hypothetical protein